MKKLIALSTILFSVFANAYTVDLNTSGVQQPLLVEVPDYTPIEVTPLPTIQMPTHTETTCHYDALNNYVCDSYTY